MDRRDSLRLLSAGTLAAGAQFPLIKGAIAQDRYAKYRGQTIVVNYPAHLHYDQAEKLFDVLGVSIPPSVMLRADAVIE